MALQRTDIFGRKANTEEVREYILRKLTEHEITFEILNDKNEVSVYPSKCNFVFC